MSILVATIFAYLGPETMLPMTSIIAGAAGVLMMFGRNSLRWASEAWRKLGGRPGPRAERPSRRIGAGMVARIPAGPKVGA